LRPLVFIVDIFRDNDVNQKRDCGKDGKYYSKEEVRKAKAKIIQEKG
jgi:hypothetical protein